MKLFVVTPSYINSQERLDFARDSLHGLRDAIGKHRPHVVVNDLPRGTNLLTKHFPTRKWRVAGKMVYNQPNIIFIQRNRRGSNSATLDAVREARLQGAELIFIHLDDNVYTKNMPSLIEYACDAFEKDNELVCIRFSAYPIISRKCIPVGNRALLEITDTSVSFSNVILKPHRMDEYTLWWSDFHGDLAKGRFWPMAMWTTVYRSDFLEAVLTYNSVPKIPWLGQVEKYYKEAESLGRLLKEVSGKIGFINMQFGGLEMHRNKDWRDLIALPNIAVR